LELASSLKVKSISIPAISSGIYDFPIEKCADIFYGTLVE
jgi:O-acetyl-ADP-ribose deacetylase (regulator of RNase III)